MLLARQGRFLMLLWVFITVVILGYYMALMGFSWGKVAIIAVFSLLWMGGAYAVAWFGIRVNTFANGHIAYASLRGKPYQVNRIPLRAGMSIGMVLISLVIMWVTR